MDIKLRQLINSINSIDGISKKQAERISITFIEKKTNINNLLNQIKNSLFNLKICSKCGVISSEICENCKNINREIVVINSNKELIAIKDKLINKHYYYVFDFKRRSDYSDLDILNKKINKFVNFISEQNIKEIIFLLIPSIESELVIRMVKEILYKSDITNIELYKPNVGIPVGGSIEYSSEDTIREAINKREKI